ncbi:MAG: tetratricopeptide repeat protein, partial [Nitrospinota bacterium]|nr:tetratricopeptide repeat protein [Nitrospinota bacterium]
SAIYLSVALGTGTLYLIYLLGRQIFNREVGMIALAVSAFSLLLINYSRTALTPAGSMFFFTLGLYLLFREIKTPPQERKDTPFQLLFWAGLSIGFSFTIHYNLAYYFLVTYFFHLLFCLFAKHDKLQRLKENMILAAGLSLPLVIFEFGYPLLYFVLYKKHILFTYFQEVLYNALEAGGGSSLWSFFLAFVWLGESPAYCILILASGLFLAVVAARQRDPAQGGLLVIAFLPPLILSALDFPLVGRNLAPSLPLFAVLVGNFIHRVAEKTGERFIRWTATGLVLTLMVPSLPKLMHLYTIRSPYLQAKNDIKDKGVLLLGRENFYRNAILYQLSSRISVVPSIDSILRDPESRDYVLLTQPAGETPPLPCPPFKTYNKYNSAWFPPIRHEDGIANTAPANQFSDLFVLYNLEDCLDPVESRSPAAGGVKSVTEIGGNYAADQPGMTSLTRIQFRTGLEYLNHGHNDEAIYEFKQALKSNPKLLQGYNNLALALIKKQRYGEALDFIHKAEFLVPGMYETQNLFGRVYFSMGDFDRAIASFENAIRIQPKIPTSYQYLIKIYANQKKDIGKVKYYVGKLENLGPK